MRKIKCCRNECTRWISREHVVEVRQDYYGVKAEDRWKVVFNCLRDREKSVEKDGMLIVKGSRVCSQGFCAIYGITLSTFYVRKSECEQRGAKVRFHGNKGLTKTKVNTVYARVILEERLRELGEPMPHDTFNGENGSDRTLWRLPLGHLHNEQIYQ